MEIRKAVIPAGGLGTRLLPATKALSKEMIPIVDKPAIQYIVEEAIESGIEDIIIISSRGKHIIEDHFDKSYELEETLLKKNKTEMLNWVQKISNLTNIHYIRQKEARGLGNAIYCARNFIGNEPFAVLLGDDIIMSPKPCLKQLIDVFNSYHSPIVGVQTVDQEDVSKYGIVKPKSSEIGGKVIHIETLVEKPEKKAAPSNLAIMGRYILSPDIFDILKDLPPGSGGEIQLTDAINIMNQSQKVLAYQFDGIRYDVGNKIGFIRATLDIALQRPDLRDDVLKYLKAVIKKERLGG
ncbi:UTP--glucose-1-phosphate uridylyltransferase GalU [Metabacillus arenae]|uniref:UTP--glucose-1-phosphate uridylyltransferase n=1 Tax=Metabacillus arenae TaxID=2771434 RepID=A0A926NHV0_9BACI|nr:UTP--glucose-1-phosphate uridylyltransferase GalU [Metabacillus arenae]MBD1381939.1 UTP--glucose-1-phosphate uridylyltransferase GalU [Metabacillus arenae]